VTAEVRREFQPTVGSSRSDDGTFVTPSAVKWIGLAAANSGDAGDEGQIGKVGGPFVGTRDDVFTVKSITSAS
jgi:hypothetical protein